MPLARSESERFRERHIPIEFARAFDRAATFVAVCASGRRSESGGVEKRERRAAANSQVRIANLIGAQRETRAGAIVRRGAAQISRDRRSGLPGDDILQPPIAESVFGPAVSGRAMVLAERQFVQRQRNAADGARRRTKVRAPRRSCRPAARRRECCRRWCWRYRAISKKCRTLATKGRA